MKRSRTDITLNFDTYKRIVRDYCKALASEICETGMIELPRIGSLAVSLFRRKPRYRNNKFVGYGKYDWEKKEYDGSKNSFGVAFLPRHDKNNNLRCYGFVANRRLYQKLKEIYEKFDCPWVPLGFTNEMI